MKVCLILSFVLIACHVCGADDDVKAFLDLAMEATSPQVSDKVKSHAYQEVYGRFLIPHIREVHGLDRGYRFLEIGAGVSGLFLDRAAAAPIDAAVTNLPSFPSHPIPFCSVRISHEEEGHAGVGSSVSTAE